MMHSLAKSAAGLHQFMRVIAVRSSNHYDHIRLLRQFNRRILPLLRWLADCVNETHF
jgi:hypothetical protein